MLRKYVVCEEQINGKYFYTVRVNTDCSPARFSVIADFDTFEEANEFIHRLNG